MLIKNKFDEICKYIYTLFLKPNELVYILNFIIYCLFLCYAIDFYCN